MCAERIQELLGQLKSSGEEWLERKLVVRELGELLLEAVEEANDAATEEAFDAGGEEAVNRFRAGLGPQPRVAGFVAEGVQQLQDSFADEACGVREQAAQALGKLGASAAPAVPALARLLLDDTQDSVQSAAAVALCTLGRHSVPAIPALAQALARGAPKVRLQAASALGAVGAQATPAIGALVESLADEGHVAGNGWAGGWVAARAAAALGKIGEAAAPAVPQLTALLRAPGKDGDVSESAGRSLAQLAKTVPAATLALAEALVDQNSVPLRVRKHAADALGPLSASGAIQEPEAVVGALQSVLDDEGIRRKAIEALGHFGEAAAPSIPRLVELARNDSDEDIRREATKALGNLRSVDRIPELLEALCMDEEFGVRVAAAKALGKFGADAASAVPEMAKQLLAEKMTFVQLTIVPVLGQLGKVAGPAAGSLTEVLRAGATLPLRECAAAALGELGEAAEPAALELGQTVLKENANLARAALGALEKLGTAATPALQLFLEALSGEEPETRRRAAEALGRPVLLEELHRLATGNDCTPEPRAVGLAAAAAIRRITGSSTD